MVGGIVRPYNSYRGYRRNHSNLGVKDRDWFGVKATPHNNYPTLHKIVSDRGEISFVTSERFAILQERWAAWEDTEDAKYS